MNKIVGKITRKVFILVTRKFSTTNSPNFRVTICGGAGGIGQPLALLLKRDPLVCELKVHDIVLAPGVAVDLSHIDTLSPVSGHKGAEGLYCALYQADVVVVPAGVPRKPGMTRDDLFNMNAGIVRDLAYAVAENCPNALLAIITNPVNSTVPIAAEVLKKKNVYYPSRLFGVTTLDVVRAKTFLANAMHLDPQLVDIPVIGGHSGITILPVISKTTPHFEACDRTIIELTERIQDAGTEVVEAKGGAGSATLSMAYAAARFVNSLLRGLKGESKVVECAYVESKCTDAKYFATPVLLGKDGVKKNYGLPRLNAYETKLLKECVPELKKNITKGEHFINPPPKVDKY